MVWEVEDSMKKRNLIKMAPVTLAAITALTAVFSFGSADSIKVAYGEETSITEKEDEIEEWVKIRCKVADGYDMNVNHKKR